jgi:hypothetical protein
MNKNFIIVIILVIAFGAFYFYNQSQPGELDEFAQCITDSGAKFYGAFWCSHCQSQKSAFGRSQKLLPYIECSAPDGRGQLTVCQENNINGYPTWEFADGSRREGEIPLGDLAQLTGCNIP